MIKWTICAIIFVFFGSGQTTDPEITTDKYPTPVEDKTTPTPISWETEKSTLRHHHHQKPHWPPIIPIHGKPVGPQKPEKPTPWHHQPSHPDKGTRPKPPNWHHIPSTKHTIPTPDSVKTSSQEATSWKTEKSTPLSTNTPYNSPTTTTTQTSVETTSQSTISSTTDKSSSQHVSEITTKTDPPLTIPTSVETTSQSTISLTTDKSSSQHVSEITIKTDPTLTIPTSVSVETSSQKITSKSTTDTEPTTETGCDSSQTTPSIQTPGKTTSQKPISSEPTKTDHTSSTKLTISTHGPSTTWKYTSTILPEHNPTEKHLDPKKPDTIGSLSAVDGGYMPPEVYEVPVSDEYDEESEKERIGVPLNLAAWIESDMVNPMMETMQEY